MTIEDLLARWPWCYHVTARPNLSNIARAGCLLPTNDLVARAGQPSLASIRRPRNVRISIAGRPVVLRNQSPLASASLCLPDGITLGDYVRYLNSRVFLWPGDGDTPTGRSLRMLTIDSGQLALRMPTSSLLLANSPRLPCVSACNAGATWGDALPVVRSLDLFAMVERFSYTASEIVEISYPGRVNIPHQTEYAVTIADRWRPVTR
jgi:hypothetical protein